MVAGLGLPGCVECADVASVFAVYDRAVSRLCGVDCLTADERRSLLGDLHAHAAGPPSVVPGCRPPGAALLAFAAVAARSSSSYGWALDALRGAAGVGLADLARSADVLVATADARWHRMVLECVPLVGFCADPEGFRLVEVDDLVAVDDSVPAVGCLAGWAHFAAAVRLHNPQRQGRVCGSGWGRSRCGGLTLERLMCGGRVGRGLELVFFRV